MEEIILHLTKDGQLVGIMTPDIQGMDHIIYPGGTSDEIRTEVLNILATIPNSRDLVERETQTKEAYGRAGFDVEKVSN